MQRYFLLCFNNHIFTVNFASVQQFIGTFKKNIIDFTAIAFDNPERHRNGNIVIFINKILSFAIGGNPLPSGGGRSLVNCYPICYNSRSSS